MQSRQYLDEQIIQKVKNGDPEAFGLLYDQYAEMVFRYAFSQLDNRFDAEELTEEIFLRSWKALPGYDERGTPFITFLFQVARTSLIEFHRHHKPSPSLDGSTGRPREPGLEESVSIQADNPVFRATLAKLPEEYRSVLIFRFLVCLTVEETAQVMQRTAGAALILQHRALSALRQYLESGSHV